MVAVAGQGTGGRKMMRILYAAEIARRLNVSTGTLHKREFRKRIGLSLDKFGKQLGKPEPMWDEWVLKRSGSQQNA